MKKYPEIETQSQQVGSKFKGHAKTKMPCGVIIVSVAEQKGSAYAVGNARRVCEYTARNHLEEHECDKN